MNYIPLEAEDYILARYRNAFKKQGIETVEDLLRDFPIRYENYHVSSIKDAKLEENICLEGSIQSKVTVTYLKAKLSALNFLFEVEGKIIRATIFNRVYLKTKLDYGTVIRATGRFVKSLNNFTISDLILCDEIDREIVPLYKTKDISEAKYIEIMDKVVRRYGDKLNDDLPLDLIQKHNLVDINTLIKYLHQPKSMQEVEIARRRLKYEELLKYQVSMKYLHYMREHANNSPSIDYKMELLDELRKSLPYELTADQERAINDILKDLKATYCMNRLLQGEVGSGKTIVAIMAILACVSGGYQAAFMCPTEILSKQHFDTLSAILKPFKLRIELLTGSTPAKQRKMILEDLKTGVINIIIGTHALFQKDVEYDKLGIVIADEEHRFGVRQRVLIRNKGIDVNYLKMSATPIPRTLSISAYGDMDISIIKEMPKNRKPVVTKYIEAKDKRMVFNHIKEELKKGHQIYVVTPLINESESLDTANATEIYENFTKAFKEIATVGLIHGRLPGPEKEEIMQKFLDKEIDILVATSVIEVGVNVINATTILILGAERFGVATLHQLRGRVMRSSYEPFCFLIPEKVTEVSTKRLQMVEQTTDGFALAEYDLINRGPGEFFGEKQSGSMNFKYADLRCDNDLLLLANDDSEKVLNDGTLFNNPDYQSLFEVAKKNYLLKMEEID